MTRQATIPVFATGKDKVLAHLAMIVFAALIAGSFSLGDMVAPFLAPAALNAIRFFCASILMALFAKLITGKAPPFPVSPGRFVILGALMATYFVLMFTALQITSPVSTGAVFTLIPLMSAVFAVMFLGQSTKPLTLMALIIGAMGAIWVIFNGDLQAILSFNIGKGEALFLIGCACHAAYTPLIKKYSRKEPLINFTFYTLVATFCWLFVVSIPSLAKTNWGDIPPLTWLVIGYLFVFTTAGTFFLVQFAAIRLPAAKVMAYGYLTPVFIILLEGLLGHGWATISIMAGAGIITLELLVIAVSPDG